MMHADAGCNSQSEGFESFAAYQAIYFANVFLPNAGYWIFTPGAGSDEHYYGFWNIAFDADSLRRR